MSEIPEVVADELPVETQQEEITQTPEAPVEAPAEVPVEAPAEQAAPQAEAVKAPKQKKRRSVPVKIVMALLAIILCVAIFAVSLAGVLILNIRTVVSRDGITNIVNQLVAGPSSVSPMRPALAAGTGRVYLDEYESGESDMSNLLVDWAYDLIQETFGDEVELTKEQVKTFVQESTAKDFVADKAAGLVEDFYNEESNTTITVEEIVQLMEENKEIIEEQFGVVIDQEVVEQMNVKLEESGILQPIEEKGLMTYIEETLVEEPSIDGAVGGGSSTGNSSNSNSGANNMKESLTKAKEIMNIVRQVTSYKAVAVLAAVFVLLLVALFFVTGRSFPATLSQTGSMVLLTGVIFGVPTILCKAAPALVNSLLGKDVGNLVGLVLNAAAGVNFTVLGVGFGLIVAAIVVKIVKSAKAKKV